MFRRNLDRALEVPWGASRGWSGVVANPQADNKAGFPEVQATVS
jgi:hypothetical protein